MGKKDDSVDIILDGLDENSISSILSKWYEVRQIKKQLENIEEMLKNKTKAYLKERSWERYLDEETTLSVTLTTRRKKTIDTSQLKMILSEAQLAQISKVSTYEQINLMSKKDRERLSKYVKPKKKF